MGHTEVVNSVVSERYRCRYRALLGFSSCILLVAGQEVHAGVWDISPNVTLSEIYLKNDGLALIDQADQDYVTEVSPSITVHKEGQRAKLDMFYRMQNLWYRETSDLNSTYHQYSANVSADLVRNIFSVEVGATRTQQILDPNNVVTFDNLTTTANRSDVDTYSLKPQYRYQFGSFAKVEANISYDRVSYAGSNLAGTDNVGYFASAASGDRFDRFSWAGSFKRIEYLRKDDRDDEFSETLLFDVGYQVKKRLTAIAGVGYENSNIQRTTTGESGGSWKIGAKWEPSLRTTLTGTIGQRFYGRSAYFQFRHQHKKTLWDISYTENVTHVSQLILGSTLFTDPNASQDDTALVTTGNPVVTPIIDTPAVTTGLFLSKRWNASYLKTSFRSQFSLRGFYEDRELAIGGDSDIIYGASASVGWAVGSRTTSSVSGDWQRQQLVANGKEDDDLWSIGMEISHRLSISTVVSISARRVRRESPAPLLNYQQDQIGATLVIGL